MSFFGGLFASKKAIGSAEALGNIADKLFTSDEERATAEIIKQKIAMQPSLIQAEIMRVQASHRNWFRGRCATFFTVDLRPWLPVFVCRQSIIAVDDARRGCT